MSMRFVSQEVSQALDGTPHAAANFGLVFNKWLLFEAQNGDKVEPVVKQNRQPLISQYEKSKKKAAELLQHRHCQQASYCHAMARLGWQAFIVCARLTAPFVSGLGMSHPTETGLVLDHTIGVPYIPAASQKGVLRVTYLINSLRDENGDWLSEEALAQLENIQRLDDGELRWHEDAASQTLFGSGGDKNALAGQVVVLDAYPLAPPELGEEILNPHFKDYYEGRRGPSEDQSPVPVKFLVVKPGAQFVFRMLLRQPLVKAPEQNQDRLTKAVRAAIERALTEEGLGAKTALGFGRFAIEAEHEPREVEAELSRRHQAEETRLYPWRPILLAIQNASDWGQLKQTALDNPEAQKYQSQPEVSAAVKETAERIRAAYPKNWAAERDEAVAQWIAASGLSWQASSQAPAEPADSLSAEDQAAVARIKGIQDWGVWKNSKIETSTLPFPALLALKERLIEWKCNDKKAKDDKKQIWKEVVSLLRNQSSLAVP